MKKIVQYMVLTVSCLGAVVFGQQANESQQINATVRIIRKDDLQKAYISGTLPRSFTGAVVTKDGFVFTTIDAARPASEDVTEKAKLDTTVENNEYLVLLPKFDPKDGRVVEVRAHTGLSRFRSEESRMLAIKLPDRGIPTPLIVDQDILENNSNTELSGMSYPAARYAGIAQNPEAVQSVLKDLREFEKKVERNGAPVAFSEKEQSGHSALMNYMSSYRDTGRVNGVSNQIGGGTGVSHSVKIGEGSEGAPLLDIKTGKIKALAVATNQGEMVDFSAIRNDSILIFATSNKLSLPKAIVIPWLWISVGGGSVLIILIIVLCCMPQKPSPRDLPILKLCGQDGTKYTLTSRELQHGVLLGRSSKAEKRFEKNTISGKHARISALNGKVVIIDEESKGGTYINDEKIEPGVPKKIHDGDIIKLADFKIKISAISQNKD